MKLAFLVAALVLSGCAAMDTPETCRISALATVPLRVVRGLPLIDVEIAGQPARMLLDTGADTTVLSHKGFERLKLEQDYSSLSYSTGLGARGVNWATKKASLHVGAIDLEDTSLLVVRFTTDVPFDGVLGGKSLAAYDLDIDMPARRLTFNAGRRCPGTPPFSPSTTLRSAGFGPYRLTAEIVVDGATVAPIVDTGASNTILDQARLGLADSDVAADRTGRIVTADPVGLSVQAHRFKQVVLGSETIDRPVILVGKIQGNDGLLGADVWRTRRLWVSYLGRTVTVGPPVKQAAPRSAP